MPGGIEETPRDELTGQPLSVLARGRDFHIEDLDCTPEYHHQLHPENDAELGNNSFGNLLPAGNWHRSEGAAVRYSKGQVLPSWLHDRYHDLFFGPKLPTVSSDKHKTVLMGIAKVIPLQAIDIYKKGSFKLVNLSNSEHDFIRRTTFHEGAGRGWEHNHRGRIGTYLAHYALKHFLPEMIDENGMAQNIDLFFRLSEQLSKPRELRWDEAELEANKGQPTRKQLALRQLSKAGEAIIQQSINASVEPVRPCYEEAIKKGMVRGTKRDLGLLAMKCFGTGRFPTFSENLKMHIMNAWQVPSEVEEGAMVAA